VLPEENQEIIEQFLATHPDFKVVSCKEILDEQRIPLESGVFLEISPQRHETDAFFAAALERRAGPE
jgi:16S rRNA (cytosine967-C5)-methyltransferase